ncbi:MAG: SRPBCC family protein, partial [Bdellovibrionales bacterium]|nr:SRPBCC family protein [Bdellovibrionales bacterium]
VEGEKMNTKIQIEATIRAPLQKVWAYWTSPEHITKWNFAIPEWHCPKATNDLRVAGKYFARMEAKDGSFGFDFEAVYDEVIPQEKIVYSMPDGRKVTTTFAHDGTATKVTTIFDAEKQNPEEMQRNGWQSILNNFKKYSEAN